MVVHTLNLSTCVRQRQEKLLSLKPALSTLQTPRQPRLSRETHKKQDNIGRVALMRRLNATKVSPDLQMSSMNTVLV